MSAHKYDTGRIVMSFTPELTRPDVVVRPLRRDDLPVADHIFRLAFGTFIGLPDPLAFAGDADLIRPRYLADPSATFGAEVDGELVGSNVVTSWGTVGFFGPLTVRPDHWDRGIAKLLLERTVELFEQWGITHAGLFTFADSPKHIHLYQKFGFWPQFLTMIMSIPVRQTATEASWTSYSEVPESQRGRLLSECRELTSAIYEGLDVEREIRAVDTQGLGDTVLLVDNSTPVGLAVCHCGPGSEAGSGMCYVKFGAVRPGPTAGTVFERLLDACEAFAAARGASRLVCGVNTARHDAYRRMLARGFRANLTQGVVMARPNGPGYNRPDVYLIDDWR